MDLAQVGDRIQSRARAPKTPLVLFLGPLNPPAKGEVDPTWRSAAAGRGIDNSPRVEAEEEEQRAGSMYPKRC